MVGLNVNQLSTAAYCATVKMPELQQRRSKAALGKSTPFKKKKTNQGLLTVILKLHGKMTRICSVQPDFPQMLSSIAMRKHVIEFKLTPRA